ncbi:MAG: hypothetical protein V1789_08940 [PVC group bacterium]
MNERNKRKTVFLNLLLLVITVVVVIVLAETGYRAYKVARLPAPPEEQPATWVCYHETLGWTHIPNASIGKIYIDRHGFRSGYEEEKNGPLPEKIIAAFGDSFTFADGLNGSSAWPYLLGKMTEKRGFGVVNAGVCAYGVDQMYLRYREKAEGLEPVVVLAGIIGWDIQRVVRSRWKDGGRHKPRFVYRDGGITLDHVPVPLELEEDLQATRWHDIIFDHKKLYLFDRFFPPEERLWKSLPKIPPNVYEAKNIPLNKYAEGVLLTQEIIEEWREEVEGEGRRFILILIPLRERVYYYHSYLVTLRDNLARQGVEIVDCQKAFQAAERDGKDLFRGAHPSRQGQEVIAGEVYYYLVSTGAI